MMNYSKPLRLHLFENYFQDINVSYHLQTLFNWIKDLLIWASLWSLWRRLTWQTLSRPHTIWHVITHQTVDLDSFIHLLDNFYQSSFYNDSVSELFNRIHVLYFSIKHLHRLRGQTQPPQQWPLGHIWQSGFLPSGRAQTTKNKHLIFFQTCTWLCDYSTLHTFCRKTAFLIREWRQYLLTYTC